MGFTQSDCVVCYLGGYGNKKASIRKVCSVCIESIYEEDGFGNVQTVCLTNFASDGKCERCHDERIFLFSIGLCDNDILVNDEEDDEEDFYTGAYDDEEEEEDKLDDNSEEILDDSP
jgi:hypothetical protein